MNLPEVKYSIPSDILTSTIEAMRDYSRLLEAEAAALARLESPDAEKHAQERLEDAEVARKLFEFYLNL